jgi:hypothetical protein
VGFTKNAVEFLLHCRSRGVDFSSCATIGRQILYLNAAELRAAFARAGQTVSADEANEVFQSGGNYAEPMLRLLGGKTIHSFDASAYESATIVTDFNNPLDESHKGRYSAVIDGGSLEHVFNYPQGLKNAMEMVRPGGHLMLITPTHSRSGHGFYQLSAELFHRVFTGANGYESPETLVSSISGNAWYDVPDPAAVRDRVIVDPRAYSDHLFVLARRSSVATIFAAWPQQSDYAAAWVRPETIAQPAPRFKGYLRVNRHRLPRFVLRLHSWLSDSRVRALKRIQL